MKFSNTLQKGSVRTIIFKEKGQWFGVALDFNIVEAGDDPREVMIMLDEAIRGYVDSARKAKLRPHVLNQAPRKNTKICGTSSKHRSRFLRRFKLQFRDAIAFICLNPYAERIARRKF